jgi:tetratricopeptide (TPR) repeat protein
VREGWNRGGLLPPIVMLLLIAPQPGSAQQRPVGSMPVTELVERGRTYLQNHEPAEARRVLEEAVARAPKLAEAWSLLADSYAQLGIEEKAIEGYRAALGLRPDLPNALYNIGILLLKRQRFDEAVGYFQTLLQQQPGDQDVTLLLARCQMQLGRREEATALLEETVRGPKAPKAAYLSLAATYVETSQNVRAVEVLHKARIRWPGDEEISSALTSELMRMEDPAGALTSQNTKLSPEDLVLLAGCYARRNRLQEAGRFAEQAVSAGGGEPALLALANVLQMEGRNQDAIKLLEPQKDQFSSSAKYLFTLGMSYYNVGNYSCAKYLFTTAARLAPMLAQAHYFEGNALARLGQVEAALAPYAEAVRLDPGKYLYRFHYGLALSNLGQKGPGEEQLKQAVEINGSFAPARYELARIYSERSRDDLAREQLEEAIKADPDYTSSYYLLSQVYDRLGRHEDAMRMLEQFRTLQHKQHEAEERALTGAGSRGPNP